MSIIIDASTAMAAVLPDENSEYARAAVALALRQGLVVPALWLYEIQNALMTAHRRNRIDAQSLHDAIDALRGLRAQIEAPQGLGHELRLGLAHQLTAYDAAYLAVALSTGAALATNDQRLRRAAETAGVVLFNGPQAKVKPTQKRR